MPITVAEYLRLSPRILDELARSARAGVNAAGAAVTDEARKAVIAVVGGDGTLSHLRGSKVIKPYFRRAQSEDNPVCLVGVSGPAHLLEHPRKGGYQVKARRKQAAVVETFAALGLETRQALATPQGPRGGVRPGPITNPRAPVTKTFDRAPQIVQKAAEEAVHAHLARNGWGD